ncbi:MAG TPA: zinc-ribbon domain-containing protein [Archaeoglobus profundus]|nr:zinc-ribbon domain-containing protein [Archaeoglobus profundus]
MNKKYCQYCGTELSSDDIFCSHCGAKIAENPSDVTAVTTIQNAIMRRSETDIRMSGAWILILIVSPLISFLGLISMFSPTMIYIGSLLIFLSMILVALLYYKLINRRNKHFMRSRILRESLINYIESKSKKLGKSNDVASELSIMRIIHSELSNVEKDRSAGLYAFLSAVTPFVSLYIMYFLTKEFTAHDSKERTFFQTFSVAADKLGMSVQFPSWIELPSRPAGLYLILTIIFGGLFAIYWLWTLIKDPNLHFDTHTIFEDSLLSSINTY